MEPLADLIAALLGPVPVDLTSEQRAIALVVRRRWPQGLPFCSHCDVRRELIGCHLRCPSCSSHYTVFSGTPLGRLRRPRVRVLLLAMRAIAVDKRGIAARPLARLEGIPHVTVWRHIHLLRDLLASAPDAIPPTGAVQVCGRRGTAPAGTVVVARAAHGFSLGAASRVARPRRSPVRLVGESVRTWLNGTFHGVSRKWLSRYLLEATTRLNATAEEILEHYLCVLDCA